MVINGQRRDPRLAHEFGARVRAARLALGLSQEKLAELASVHRTFIGQIETGSVGPTLVTIVRLASALGIDPAELVKGLQPTNQ